MIEFGDVPDNPRLAELRGRGATPQGLTEDEFFEYLEHVLAEVKVHRCAGGGAESSVVLAGGRNDRQEQGGAESSVVPAGGRDQPVDRQERTLAPLGKRRAAAARAAEDALRNVGTGTGRIFPPNFFFPKMQQRSRKDSLFLSKRVSTRTAGHSFSPVVSQHTWP